MVRQLTTKAQVNGYRFLLRRQEHALVRRDVRMLHDPMRAERNALLAGMLVGVLLLGGCGIYGLVKPQGTVGDSTILVSKNSGAMYVRLDDRLHPVLNLASARLIVGSAASPKSVSDDVLARYSRGPLLGIPGAPSSLAAPRGSSQWSVCDSATGRGADSVVESTTLLIGAPTTAPAQARIGSGAVVAAADGTYLIFTAREGERTRPVRARIDTASVPILRAIGAEGVPPRPMSPALLNSVPRVPDLVVPVIVGSGLPSALGADVPVGSVVRTVDAAGKPSFHVLLSDGVQRISSVVADVLLLAGGSAVADAGAPARSVSAAALAGLPVSDALPVNHFPSATPHLVDVTTAPVLCQEWRADTAGTSSTSIRFSRTVPLGPRQRLSVPVGADGSGPGVDAIGAVPGGVEYFRVTGLDADSPRRQGRYLVSDNGIRYCVADAQTGSTLGLGDDTEVLAPWPMVSLLAPGPTLSKTDALVAHAGMPPDRSGVPVVRR